MRTGRVLTVAVSATLAIGLATAPAGSATSAAPTARADHGTDGADRRANQRADQRALGPRLRVRVIKEGLDHPWDLTFLPGGGMLYTQRDRLAIRYRGPKGADRAVRIDTSGMWVSGEAGLMSILAAGDFTKSRQFLTCYAADAPTATGHDVRVVLWHLATNFTRATRVRRIITGLPTVSGRHSGCALQLGPEGALYVGTGDAAQTKNPQSLSSGGGKVLRVVPKTGRPWKGNPFRNADNLMKRRIYTYGHRNVQGLALRPGSGMCGRSSRAPTATTRSTGWCREGITAGSPVRGTTSHRR